jgi:hypothetical protein
LRHAHVNRREAERAAPINGKACRRCQSWLVDRESPAPGTIFRVSRNAAPIRIRWAYGLTIAWTIGEGSSFDPSPIAAAA